MGKKTCFVVMGFGQKTDYRTSRVLDLDRTYKYIIKPAVEQAGLECVRADEITHSGTIDVPMYEQLLEADLVVADLSSSNVNAAYELGVRYALRPATTVVIAEDQFDFPFDVNHISILKYRHDGKALDVEVVETFRDKLRAAIEKVVAAGTVDSPVYTFLKSLRPPSRESTLGDALSAAADIAAAPPAPAAGGSAPPADAATATTAAALMERGLEAMDRGDFTLAKALLEARRTMTGHVEPYVIQQLALATYRSKYPDAVTALDEAREILRGLDPMDSNDVETLGLWGAIHKRHWELSGDRKQLDLATAAYEKGYRLARDPYNGINFAFLLNVRASIAEDPAESIADFVLARRTRRDILGICESKLAGLQGRDEQDQRYWVLATMAEASLGLGDDAAATAHLERATALATKDWMLEGTREQLDKLRVLLASSPLERIRA